MDACARSLREKILVNKDVVFGGNGERRKSESRSFGVEGEILESL